MKNFEINIIFAKKFCTTLSIEYKEFIKQALQKYLKDIGLAECYYYCQISHIEANSIPKNGEKVTYELGELDRNGNFVTNPNAAVRFLYFNTSTSLVLSKNFPS